MTKTFKEYLLELEPETLVMKETTYDEIRDLVEAEAGPLSKLSLQDLRDKVVIFYRDLQMDMLTADRRNFKEGIDRQDFYDVSDRMSMVTHVIDSILWSMR